MFIVYEIDTTKLLFGYGKHFATQSAAKGALTKEAKKKGLNMAQYDIKDVDSFAKIEAVRTVINKMSGKVVSLPYNTPTYLDPSCDAYWQM